MIESERCISSLDENYVSQSPILSPDQQFIQLIVEECIKGDSGESIGLWVADAKDGRTVLMPHTTGVHNVYYGYFSPESTLLAYPVQDDPFNYPSRTTILVQTETGEIFREMQSTDILGWLPDGRAILEEINNKRLTLFNPKTNRLETVIIAEGIREVFILSSGTELIIATSNNIQYINIDTGQHELIHQFGDGSLQNVILSSNENKLAVWVDIGYKNDEEGRYQIEDVYVIDLQTRNSRQLLSNATNEAMAILYTFSGGSWWGKNISATGKFVTYVRHYGDYKAFPTSYDNERLELHTIDTDTAIDYIISENITDFILHPYQDIIIYKDANGLFASSLDSSIKNIISEQSTGKLQFHPTQDRIYYEKTEDKPLSPLFGGSALYSARLDGSDTRLIANDVMSYVFSPDGESVAYGIVDVLNLDQDGHLTPDTTIHFALATATIDGENRNDIASYDMSIQELETIMENNDRDAGLKIRSFYPIAWTKVE